MSDIKNKISINIIDYLGKHEGGVITLLSLGLDGTFYEATFFYTEDLLVLTPDKELEKELECDIEDYEGYTELMISIIKKVVPYDEIINIVDDFEPNKYDIYLDKNNKEDKK